MPTNDLRDLVREWVDAFNRGDWEHLLDLLGPGVITHNLLEVTPDVDMSAGRMVTGDGNDVVERWKQIKENNVRAMSRLGQASRGDVRIAIADPESQETSTVDVGRAWVVDSDKAWIVDEGKDTVISLVTWNGPDLDSGRDVSLRGALIVTAPTFVDDQGTQRRRVTRIVEHGDLGLRRRCGIC